MSRIETHKTILPHLPVSTEERAGNLIEACVARGTAHLRTHVDIDLESRPLKLDGMLAARERHRGRTGVQIVAFPQSGVMRCPGVLDLLGAVVRSSPDLVGGIDPLEIDRDPNGTAPEARARSPLRLSPRADVCVRRAVAELNWRRAECGQVIAHDGPRRRTAGDGLEPGALERRG